jgi:hypothetical protein
MRLFKTDEIPDRSNLREERFILANGFRSFISSWQAGYGWTKQLTSWHLGSREIKRIPALFLFFPFYSI